MNEQGEPHGEGRLCECNAFDLRIRIYFGEFKDGKKDGKGKIYDLFHGTIEYGIWKDDERKEYLGVYVGEVKKVIPLIYPQENIFDGMFNIVRSCFTQLSALEDVIREGKGEVSCNGYSREGEWKDDKILYGKITVDGKLIFEGRFIDGEPDLPDYSDKGIIRISHTD